MRARNPLYVMAKPPPDVQAQIAALPRNDPSRGNHLLHVTLISSPVKNAEAGGIAGLSGKYK